HTRSKRDWSSDVCSSDLAFSYILDSIPFLKFSIWAQGGSISLVMIPIFLLSFRWGLKGGLVGGALLGILKLILGRPYILVPLQRSEERRVGKGCSTRCSV